MPTILCLETATNACSVALQVHQKIYLRHEIAPRQHAMLILPMIQSLLNEAGILCADLQAIAFGCGPGSFMGARLAVGLAQGLAFGCGIPVIPISTLQIIAQTAHEKGACERALIGWDARMGDIYWGLYACDHQGVMQPMQEDQLSAPSVVSSDALPTSFCVAGNAWSVYANQLPVWLLSKIATESCDCYPEAQAMLPIALARFAEGKLLQPSKARPVYLRNKVTG